MEARSRPAAAPASCKTTNETDVDPLEGRGEGDGAEQQARTAAELEQGDKVRSRSLKKDEKVAKVTLSGVTSQKPPTREQSAVNGASASLAGLHISLYVLSKAR